MATVGDRLATPESGWKRYDDKYTAIKYEGTWKTWSDSSAFNGSYQYSQTAGNKVMFNFIGTKLRIIGVMQSNRPPSIPITIDGVTEYFSEYLSSGPIVQALVYEKINLENKLHRVEISVPSPLNYDNISIDAIDIDDTGRLLHPDEVTDIKDLDIGKRIRCHYQASSGQVGVFSGLGEETSDFIPPTSSANPNGDFYWICVDRDHLGRWKLIADRNIQHSISWDKINEQGMTNTGREITF